MAQHGIRGPRDGRMIQSSPSEICVFGEHTPHDGIAAADPCHWRCTRKFGTSSDSFNSASRYVTCLLVMHMRSTPSTHDRSCGRCFARRFFEAPYGLCRRPRGAWAMEPHHPRKVSRRISSHRTPRLLIGMEEYHGNGGLISIDGLHGVFCRLRKHAWKLPLRSSWQGPQARNCTSQHVSWA